MSEVALSIENVDKVYQRRGKPQVHAVKVLQMEVNKGEIVALLGSSGCGKTSTLRMIAGFEEVTNGGIKLTGRRIDKLPPAQRGVTMAFEGYSLYPPLTIGLLFCAVSVALSRILLGMHFLSDVLAGAAIGTALGVVAPAILSPVFC